MTAAVVVDMMSMVARGSPSSAHGRAKGQGGGVGCATSSPCLFCEGHNMTTTRCNLTRDAHLDGGEFRPCPECEHTDMPSVDADLPRRARADVDVDGEDPESEAGFVARMRDLLDAV